MVDVEFHLPVDFMINILLTCGIMWVVVSMN